MSDPFTDAMLDELAEYFITEQRKPGDMDVEQVSAQFGVNNSTARHKMKRIVADHPERWELVNIKEFGKTKAVLRRKA